MGWTGPRGSRLCSEWRTVPRSWLTVTSLPAVPTVPGKALGTVGPLARRRTRTTIAPPPTISRAIALIEVGSTIPGWFGRTIDRR
jgi:hypothetical protein